MKAITLTPLALAMFALAESRAVPNEPPAGQVVWWGQNVFWKRYYSTDTNGVIEVGNEFLTNIVSVASGHSQALLVTTDGTVVSLGRDFSGTGPLPEGLDNVVSVTMAGNSGWAIRRDGTVAHWGGQEGVTGAVSALTNVTAIVWAGNWSFLALQTDGSVLGFSLVPDVSARSPTAAENSAVLRVRVGGQPLTDVAALTGGHTPLVLMKDGSVVRLEYQPKPGSPFMIFPNPPYSYGSAEPMRVDGAALTGIVAIAGHVNRGLALKSDGGVIAWGNNPNSGSAVPAGLSKVVAISASDDHCLALKRDGTVVAWGNNHYGQTSVPAGLSNVVAIAAGASLSLAVTTGAIPAGVYVPPHGRLEQMARAADLVFKGEVLSITRTTNAAFRNPQMDVHAARFRLISVLQGTAPTNVIVFQHYTRLPDLWSGPSPPAYYRFETGRCYLVFAARLDRTDKYYTPSAGTDWPADEFRQIADFPWRDDDGVLRTLDARPLGRQSIKDAHRLELDRLLADGAATNVLYAIDHLNSMRTPCDPQDDWRSSGDFKTAEVFATLFPLVTNVNESVALAALGCFRTRPECATQLVSYASRLAEIAESAPSEARRVAAMSALSGASLAVMSNALPRWLGNSSEAVREQAVRLLVDHPGAFAEQALRERAKDSSPKVRAAVADTIGNGKFVALLPTLEELFTAPVGPTNPLPPLTLESLEAGGQLWGLSIGDVHTSAGHALLKFDADQVGAFLKQHLDDPGFRVGFLCKLAEPDAGPWRDDLTAVLESRRTRNEEKAASSGVEPRIYYFQALMALSGSYFRCWNVLYDHLQKLPPKAFGGGKLDRCLAAMENAGTTGSREPVMLYELYRMKGLNQRAQNYRGQILKEFPAFNLEELLKRVDAEHPKAPARSGQ